VETPLDPDDGPDGAPNRVEGRGDAGPADASTRAGAAGVWRRNSIATGLLVIALGFVFMPVLRAPTELLYGPRSDLLSFVHPYRALQNYTMREHGRFTLFDPLSFGGRPVVSDPQAGLFYPPNWLHLLDRAGEGEGFYGWLVLGHLLIGGFGVMLWLRGRGFGASAQLAAALVFALYGKWMHQLLVQGHLVFLPLMWLPYACVLIDRLAEAITPRRVGGLAGVAALVFLGSHPQLSFYVLVYVFLYLAAQLVFANGRRRSRLLLASVSAGLLALGLSAVTLLPVLSDLGEYVRGDGLSYAFAAARSLEPGHLLDIALPAEVPREMESRPYAGVVLVPLALLGLIAGTRRRLLVGSATALVAIGWYAIGASGGLHTLLYSLVPGFDLFRIPSRIFLLAGLPLAALVAAGIEVLRQGEPSRRAQVGVCAMAVVGAGAALVRGGETSVVLALAWSLPLLSLIGPLARVRMRLGALVVALVFIDLARFAAPLVETRPIETVLGESPVADRIGGGFGEGRVLAFNHRSRGDLSALPPTYTARRGIETLRGFNPLVPTATWELLVKGAGHEADPPAPRVTIPSFVIREPMYLHAFDTRWLVTNAPLALEGLVLRERFGPLDVHHTQTPAPMTRFASTWLYENMRRMPRAALVRNAEWVAPEEAFAALGSWPIRSVVMVDDPKLSGFRTGEFEVVPISHRGDEIEIDVDAGEGGYLVLSELFRTGWSAVDSSGANRRIHKANVYFSMLDLEAGRHQLVLRYRPDAYRVGSAISACSLLVLLGCVWVRRPACSKAARTAESDDPGA
jgi:hypothetical protein